jgi:hypothetical protein
VCLHCAGASTVLDIGPGIRAVLAIQNFARRLTGNDFEVFVHPVSRMEEIVRRAGFALARRRRRWVWGADIYIRERIAPKS